MAQTAASIPAAALPDAPLAQPKAPPTKPQKAAQFSATIIEPGQTATPLSARQKLNLSLRSSLRPIHLAPALLAAGYEQLADGDPKYGSDSGAFGERFGAAMLGATTSRILSDGVFAALLRQDPRYYRVAHGSIVHRGLLSAVQVLRRHGDGGAWQPNDSGFMGRMASSALTLAYYPGPSTNLSVVFRKFGTPLLTGAGTNLVDEFLPDLARKFPLLNHAQMN